MNLPVVKIVSAIVLMLLTFLVCMLPLCIFRQPLSLYDHRDRHTTRKRVMSLLSCFAGGVFLGTCLLHLFPDVATEVDDLVSELKLNPNYPLTEFLVGFGFLIILIIEQISISFKDGFTDSEERQTLVQQGRSSAVPENLEESVENSDYISTTYGAIQGANEPSEFNITFSSDNHPHSIFHSLLLLFALSLHSVFEGLAIGLQVTVQDVIRILLAVLIHKCIIAFSLGMNLAHSEMGLLGVIKSAIFFSLTSPIGILIGLTVVNLVKGITLVITSSILQGLAAGTFLYITLFEVLPKEFKEGRDKDRILKVLSVIVGYCVVCFLVIFLPD